MPKILYRAIHTKNPWRKVSHHTSLEKALRGNDGARALFEGTARIDYEKNGVPIGVIAWEMGATVATAVRANPDGGGLQFTEIPLEVALEAEDLRGIEPRLFSSLFALDEGLLFPEEIPKTGSVWEGAVTRVDINRFERSASARRACIAHWGTRCIACAMDFVAVYGARGEGFIHVHHLLSISEVGESYQVDPIEDLRPVCPNCHSMIHRYTPILTIEELQAMIRGDA